MKRLEQVRQLSVVLHLRQANEWCGLLKISIIGESWNIEDKILFNEIKGLILIADRRTAETSGVGLSAILLCLISGCPFRLFGQKFGRRIGIGLTNYNVPDKIRNGQPLETESVYRCDNYT